MNEPQLPKKESSEDKLSKKSNKSTTTSPIIEFDTQTRFKAMAAVGDLKNGLQLLDKLDSLTGS